MGMPNYLNKTKKYPMKKIYCLMVYLKKQIIYYRGIEAYRLSFL